MRRKPIMRFPEVLEVFLVLVLLLAVGCRRASQPTGPTIPRADSKPIVCYVGPNMKRSMQELAGAYTQKTGQPVQVESDEVRKLIDKLVANRAADLFVTHDPFLNTLVQRGIHVQEVWTAASVEPVIAVPLGNPQHITGLPDLGRPGLRVGLTDSDQAISGWIVSHMLRKAGIARAVEANVVKRALQGRELGDALLAGEIDACIVWNVVVFERRDKVQAIEIASRWRPQPGSESVVRSPILGRMDLDYVRVSIAALGSSPSPAAMEFARYVASPEGRAVFARNGFSPADLSRPAFPRD